MRMLMNVKFPLEPFNSAVKDGSAGPKVQKILADMKPELALFSERDGHRGGTFVVNVKDASDIPVLAEPWFLTFNAEVELRIAMTPEDLGKADLGALGKKWA
ncbi:MAG: panthothenate synthetase [Acidobacteriota bacterium]